MCDRSNSPTRSRTDRCSSRIEPYCTGIRQPAKSIIRAPSASWRSASGVSWMTVPAPRGSVTKPAPRAFRGARQPARPAPARSRTSARSGASVEVDPAHLVELVVVAREVAADRFHHVVVDGLVDPRAGLDEGVFDRIDRPGDADRRARSPRPPRGAPSPRVSRRASGVPLGRVQVRTSRSRRRPPTTSWGRPASYRTTMPPAEVAVAVLRRATAPRRRWDAGPLRSARNVPNASSPTAGLGDRGRADRVGRGPRQPERRRANGPASGPRNWVWTPATAENEALRSETESPLSGAARRTHETRRRSRRVLGGDAVSHGPQWY